MNILKKNIESKVFGPQLHVYDCNNLNLWFWSHSQSCIKNEQGCFSRWDIVASRCNCYHYCTNSQIHSPKPEIKFCAGSNPARGVLKIRDGEDLWQWFRLEIKLNAFRRSTIPQKHFIIIINCLNGMNELTTMFSESFLYIYIKSECFVKFCYP